MRCSSHCGLLLAPQSDVCDGCDTRVHAFDLIESLIRKWYDLPFISASRWIEACLPGMGGVGDVGDSSGYVIELLRTAAC